MYYFKHKTTAISNMPRGQALCSTINNSEALCDLSSCELSIRMWSTWCSVEHSGLQGGLLQNKWRLQRAIWLYLSRRDTTHHGQLWHTVDQRTHMYIKVNHQAPVHSIKIKDSNLSCCIAIFIVKTQPQWYGIQHSYAVTSHQQCVCVQNHLDTAVWRLKQDCDANLL